MRVLMVCQAEWSHAAGMVPVGWGLRAAGHDVLFATQPELVDELSTAGLPTVSVGRDHRLGEVLQRVPGSRRTGRGLEDLFLHDDADWEALSWGHGYLVSWWLALVNGPMLPDLVELCRRWRPDLVIWETTTFAGAVAARAVGARHVRFTWSVDRLGLLREQFVAERDARPVDDRADPWVAWLTACAEQCGTDFDEELVTGQATITQLPGSLRSDDLASAHVLPVRPVPYNGSRPVPAWVHAPPERPRVSVCLGLSAIARFGAYACSARDLLSALGELDIEVVATLDDSEHAGLGDLPDNVRLESFVPLDALLPSCSAVINHAGPGTLLTAAVHAVPQLLVPAEFDAPLLASRLAATGAGAVLPAEDVRPDVVRDLVRGLVDDPGSARAARHLGDEIAAMPDPCSLGRSLTAEPVREAMEVMA